MRNTLSASFTTRINYLCMLAFVCIFQSTVSLLAVELKDSTYTFRCYKYETNEGQWFVSGPTNEIVSTNYPVKVIENEYLRLVLLPDYGGRLISCYNKLTKHEELYQANPATPYCGPGGRTFYYNYLVVPGGIYPTFPEPEHGKAWNLKWDLTVVKNTADEVSVAMSYLDDKYNYVSEKWRHGITLIRCTVTITLKKNQSAFTYNVKLENTNPNDRQYEYWTCVTLTPGSNPDNTVSPLNTEMIVPVERAQYKSDWWGWMGQADEHRQPEPNVPWSGGSVHSFTNLKKFENWQYEGIAYGYPYVTANFWGAINHDKKEGMLRIANNQQHTPGLKIWTWGKNSVNANLGDPNDCRRAHMEMWAGNSREFFIADNIKANAIRQWDEVYYPTVGLSRVDTANNDCALQVDYTSFSSTDEASAFFTAKVSSIYPGQALSLRFTATNSYDHVYELYNSKKVFTGKEAITLSINQRDKQVPKGEYTLLLEIKNESGQMVMRYSKPVSVTFDLNPIKNSYTKNINSFKDLLGLNIAGQFLYVTKKSHEPISIQIFDLMGKKLIDRSNIQKNSAIRLPAQKCYILKVDNIHATYQTLITPEQ